MSLLFALCLAFSGDATEIKKDKMRRWEMDSGARTMALQEAAANEDKDSVQQTKQASASCSDVYTSSCPFWKSQDFCTGHYETWMKTHCQKTCGHCPCKGNSHQWDAGWGKCSTYASGGTNQNWCALDNIDDLFAKDVCQECGQCKAPLPVLMSFGGTNHRDSTMQMTYKGVRQDITNLKRPEAAKLTRCNVTGCYECSGESGCFHHKGDTTAMDLNTKASAPDKYDKYIAELWAKCANGEGEWKVESRDEADVNGKLEVYLDGDKMDFHHYNAGKSYGFKRWSIPLTASNKDKSRLRAIWTPLDSSKDSSTEVIITVWDPVPDVDECMGLKMCLNDLAGDGSEAGHEIRNKNELQLTCLQTGNLASMSVAHQDKCTTWLACMTADVRGNLKAILQAMVSAPSMLIEDFKKKSDRTSDTETFLEVNTSRTSTPDEVTGKCLFPSVEDPESWDCSCLSDVQQACPSMDPSCIRGLLCASENVCQAWKVEKQCPTAMDDQEALTNGDSLEESLLDKRSC